MFRFPYRNFGSKEVLVGNFTVDANGADGVGIRWFVLERSGGGAWGVANEGTYAPQPVGAPAFVHRWMGSAAMDRSHDRRSCTTWRSCQSWPGSNGSWRSSSSPTTILEDVAYAGQGVHGRTEAPSRRG